MTGEGPVSAGRTPAFDAGREAHVFCVFPQGEPFNDGEAERFDALPPEERSRAATFRSLIARRQFLYGRLLVRRCLSAYLGRPAESIELERGEEGKLFVADDPGLDFNLTHKPGCIGAGFVRGARIGVDVEAFEPDRANEKIARRFFSPPEVAQLDGLPAETLAWRFYRFWTLKEAYIKARGLGLKIPLMDFGFSFDDPEALEQLGEGIRIAFTGRIEDRPERWQFRTRRIAPDHLLSVALQGDGEPALSIRVSPLEFSD